MQTPLPTLKDVSLENQLLSKGFVVVDFFNIQTVNELLELNRDFNISKDGIYANTHESDVAFKRSHNEKIKAFYKPYVDQYFIDPLILGGSLITKPIGSGVSHPHLDWSLVEEGPFRSCNVWVPLVDLTDKNGVIEVLPGSHRLFHTYRGPNIPDRTNDLQKFYWETMTQLYLKAGQALIYDHRLIHGSKDNLSDKLRPASACAVTNSQANLRLYYYNKEHDKIEIFGGNNTEHLLSNDRFERPTSMTSLGFIENYDTRQLREEDYGSLKLKQINFFKKILDKWFK